MTPDVQPVAIITGGASGIGLALAQLLAKRGLRLVLADVDEDGLRQAAAGSGADAPVEIVQLDVSDPAAVEQTVNDVFARHGRLDYLFNNAGIGSRMDLRDATLAHWQRVVNVNLMGVIHGVQAAYPLMVKQGSGHLVNTASISGLVPWPTQTIYNTTKYAVVGLSHTLRLEAARLGVRVSVVCPGPVRTAIWGTPVFGPRFDAAGPADCIAPAEAADAIWRGVEANEATIIFPRASRRHAWLYRLHPRLLKTQFDALMREVLPP